MKSSPLIIHIFDVERRQDPDKDPAGEIGCALIFHTMIIYILICTMARESKISPKCLYIV